MILYIWEFKINQKKVIDFEKAYSSDGLWAQLFRKDSRYIKTKLIRDSQDQNHYLTIDYWKDSQSFDLFKEKFKSEYEYLDKIYESFTESEKFLGNFEEL
ncbi:MAG: hypothetical protein ABI550_09350 [Ignavibacteriaceae bacterium]